jgi:hypothetical protein
LNATQPLRKHPDFPSDRAEARLAAYTHANDDQPGQEVVAADCEPSTGWSILAYLGIAGLLTLGWLSALVWALWRFITLAVF